MEERVSRLDGYQTATEGRFTDMNSRLSEMSSSIEATRRENRAFFFALLTIMAGGFIAMATLIIQSGS